MILTNLVTDDIIETKKKKRNVNETSKDRKKNFKILRIN